MAAPHVRSNIPVKDQTAFLLEHVTPERIEACKQWDADVTEVEAPALTQLVEALQQRLGLNEAGRSKTFRPLLIKLLGITDFSSCATQDVVDLLKVCNRAASGFSRNIGTIFNTAAACKKAVITRMKEQGIVVDRHMDIAFRDSIRQSDALVCQRVHEQKTALDEKESKCVLFTTAEVDDLLDREDSFDELLTEDPPSPPADTSSHGDPDFLAFIAKLAVRLNSILGARTIEFVQHSEFRPYQPDGESSEIQQQALFWKSIGVSEQSLVVQTCPSKKSASASLDQADGKSEPEILVKPLPFQIPAKAFVGRLELVRGVINSKQVTSKYAYQLWNTRFAAAASELMGFPCTFRITRPLAAAIFYGYWYKLESKGYSQTQTSVLKRFLGHLGTGTESSSYETVQIVPADDEGKAAAQQSKPVLHKFNRSQQVKRKRGEEEEHHVGALSVHIDGKEFKGLTRGDRQDSSVFWERAHELAAAGIRPTIATMRQLGYGHMFSVKAIGNKAEIWRNLKISAKKIKSSVKQEES
jgi:hypothetical protein